MDPEWDPQRPLAEPTPSRRHSYEPEAAAATEVAGALRDLEMVELTGWTFPAIDRASEKRVIRMLQAKHERDRAQARAIDRARGGRDKPRLSERQLWEQAEKLRLPAEIPDADLDELLNQPVGVDWEVWGRPDG